MKQETGKSRPSRRDFLVRTAAGGIALGAGLGIARTAHAAGSDVIRIGLVGCGGRGTGAAVNAIKNAAGANVRLIALADAFAGPLDISLRNILREVPVDRVDVTPERKFAGLDAYEKLLETPIDLVLLCTPPGFRPMQFEAAVRAGKQVFMEKPVATDAPGIRRVLAANAVAKQKGLRVAVGFHLRHEERYREAVKHVHDGAIGKPICMRIYFNSEGVWVRPRRPSQKELEYQINNWYYFTWLSGDHIVEQHVHDIDVANWVAGGHPISADGIGGRQARIGKEFGEIFDHHVVEFTYPGGFKVFSHCHQIPNTDFRFEQIVHGTSGTANLVGVGMGNSLHADGQKPLVWKPGVEGHQAEMDHLFAAILAGKPWNEGDLGAESSMTAILGRMASYTGWTAEWDKALASNLDLSPKTIAWDAEPSVKPGPDGIYPCAIPGKTKAW